MINPLLAHLILACGGFSVHLLQSSPPDVPFKKWFRAESKMILTSFLITIVATLSFSLQNELTFTGAATMGFTAGASIQFLSKKK